MQRENKKEKKLRYEKMKTSSLNIVQLFGRPAKSRILCHMYCDWKGIKTPYINTLSVREMNKRAGNIVAALAEVHSNSNTSHQNR